MYAVVRDNTFDPEKLAQGGGNVAEFQNAHATRPAIAAVSSLMSTQAGRSRLRCGALKRKPRPHA